MDSHEFGALELNAEQGPQETPLVVDGSTENGILSKRRGLKFYHNIKHTVKSTRQPRKKPTKGSSDARVLKTSVHLDSSSLESCPLLYVACMCISM